MSIRLTPAQIATIAKEYPEEVSGTITVQPSDAVDVFNHIAATDGLTTYLTIHADGSVHRTTV
jgi:hypothetical protein